MTEIAILSGKGGTGKTSITAAFATCCQNLVLADCDVDAANMHLIMQPQNHVEESFATGEKAQVDHTLCTRCGKCIDLCRFEAISLIDSTIFISQTACDGCRLCARLCPEHAISIQSNNKSRFFIGTFRNGAMVHARLAAGEDNSGKLVAHVKQKAREMANQLKAPFLLVDGPPGIACPVIATISGADKVVLVTEPTVSGLADLSRIIALLQRFKGKVYLIVNKYDLNEEYTLRAESLATAHQILILGRIPLDRIFVDAMIQCQSVAEYAPAHPVSLHLKALWQTLIAD